MGHNTDGKSRMVRWNFHDALIKKDPPRSTGKVLRLGDELLQQFRLFRTTDLLHGPLFDLTDPFLGYLQTASDLVQGLDSGPVQAITPGEDLSIPLIQGTQGLLK